MERLLITALCVLFASTMAFGDWDPGDGDKMHYPQLPDPFGWDVYADATQAWGPGSVADDWLCSEDGPVADIHIWGSWSQDMIDPITNVYVSIYSDVPGPDASDIPGLDANGLEFSMPGTLLWDRDFSATQINVRDYGDGDQGFYVPQDNASGVWPNDHNLFHQINIENIDDPFQQVEGTIYWLEIQVTHVNADPWWGWKTTQDHFNDDAVWYDYSTDQWRELRDPSTDESLDMAFVITPEPGAICLLGLGGLALIRRKRKA